MYPSEIREHILELHERLRRLLGQALDLAREVRRGDRALFASLVDVTERIASLVLRLIEEEEDLLPPALLEADAWADVRLERMARYHRHQRAAVLTTLGRLHERRLPPRRVAEEVEDLVEELDETLCRAERILLSPEVLRDDPIVIRQVDG
jgi:hypothetical protein